MCFIFFTQESRYDIQKPFWTSNERKSNKHPQVSTYSSKQCHFRQGWVLSEHCFEGFIRPQVLCTWLKNCHSLCTEILIFCLIWVYFKMLTQHFKLKKNTLSTIFSFIDIVCLTFNDFLMLNFSSHVFSSAVYCTQQHRSKPSTSAFFPRTLTSPETASL